MAVARGRHGASLIAQSALLCALSLITLTLSCVVPTGQLGLVAIAGALSVSVVIRSGIRAGLLCYGGTSILAFFLLPNKANALLYLIFFGLYPIVKSVAEVYCGRIFAWIVKIAYFEVALLLILSLLGQLFLSGTLADTWQIEILCLVANIAFLLFDIGLSRMIALYQRRIQRFL